MDTLSLKVPEMTTRRAMRNAWKGNPNIMSIICIRDISTKRKRGSEKGSGRGREKGIIIENENENGIGNEIEIGIGKIKEIGRVGVLLTKLKLRIRIRLKLRIRIRIRIGGCRVNLVLRWGR